MPSFLSNNFGTVTYESNAVLQFPQGMPGFEERRLFLPLQYPDTKPLIFLQSLEDPALCFVTMPVLSVDPAYDLHITAEDRGQIALPPSEPLEIGTNVLCLTIVSLQESGPTANLLAPIVVNLRNFLAVQAIAEDSAYAHQHALLPHETAVCS